MKKIISSYLCLFLILFPVISSAQEEEPKPESKKITVELLDEETKLIKWEGIKYILVDEDLGNILFDRYEKYPKLELTIEGLSKLNNLYLEELRVNTEINTNLQEQNGLLMEENAGLKAKLDKGTPWYFHPILWTVIGVVCGTGITIGIMKIVKEI